MRQDDQCTGQHIPAGVERRLLDAKAWYDKHPQVDPNNPSQAIRDWADEGAYILMDLVEMLDRTIGFAEQPRRVGDPL
jgi:hypothetical protein